MNIETLSLSAGIASSVIFVSSHVPALLKAYRTRDLRSYSWLHLLLVNLGNLLYWLYVLQLPFGPIWLMHAFYTLSAGLLLVLYYRFHLSRRLRLYGRKLHLIRVLHA